MNRNILTFVIISSVFSFPGSKAITHEDLVAKSAELIEQIKIKRALKAQLDDKKPAKALPDAEKFLQIKTEKILRIYPEAISQVKRIVLIGGVTTLGTGALTVATIDNHLIIAIPSLLAAVLAGAVTWTFAELLMDCPDLKNEETKQENLALCFDRKMAHTKRQIEEYKEKLASKNTQ